MKLLDRNLVTIHCCLYQDKNPVIDEYGWETGEMEVGYSAPIPLPANVSSEKGIIQLQAFGTFEGYDKTLQLDEDYEDIDENTVWFIDKEPEFDEDNHPLYDYTTHRIAKSLNECSVAVKKVRK